MGCEPDHLGGLELIEKEKASVLIVDDEKSNLNILADILKDKYKVIVAKNGHQAIERAIKQHPDLILLDIIMPDMDGYKVLYEIKSNDLLKDIPVIIISALSDDADEEKGLVLGAVDYISKPFNHAIVLARVNNHMKIVRQLKLIESIALLDGLTEIHLLVIINDILDFSKVEANKISLEKRNFSIEEVFDSFFDLIVLKAKEKDLEFMISVDPQIPAFLIGDPLRLSQILTNLASNAVKFTERGDVRNWM